jgi:quercetin dioxygenase-like cupin family protein
MADNWYTGNAADDADQYRGWLLGHFIDQSEASARTTNALEVKWGIHPAGQERASWTTDEDRNTLVLLVSGRFAVNLTVGNVVMERQGDYVVWGPGIDHSWKAEKDSVVITVRWPSIPAAE